MLILGVLAAYVLIGLLVALVFAVHGPGRLLGGQPAVSLGARLVLIPGAAILWPLVARRLVRRTASEAQKP